MARKTVLIDDLDGKELPDDTKPVTLSLGRTTYSLYLSEANHGKLLKALDPFIAEAETSSSTPRVTGPGRGHSQVDSYGFDAKEVRQWAIANKVKVDGKPLGERGRISQGFYDAFKEAQK